LNFLFYYFDTIGELLLYFFQVFVITEGNVVDLMANINCVDVIFMEDLAEKVVVGMAGNMEITRDLKF
jgi:hypothetical protein